MQKELRFQNREKYRIFWRNNSAFMQSDHEFKKYQLWKKYIFWQLGTKIANFADIWQNNSVFTQKKKWAFLKLSVTGNHEFYGFSQNDSVLTQKMMYLKLISHK